MDMQGMLLPLHTPLFFHGVSLEINLLLPSTGRRNIALYKPFLGNGIKKKETLKSEITICNYRQPTVFELENFLFSTRILTIVLKDLETDQRQTKNMSSYKGNL